MHISGKSIAIIGASGHGRVVADIAKLVGYDEIVFLDDDSTKCGCDAFNVVGNSNDYGNRDVFVAIGDANIRQRIMEKVPHHQLVSLIHPNAVISDNVIIGPGTAIMAGAVINSGAMIGQGVIINTASSVDHDCIIEDYAHISVGAHVAGTVRVGHSTWVGAGAVISNNVNICENCMIGAGAVIYKDITTPGTYIKYGEKIKG